MVQEINTANFDSEVIKSGQITVVDFFATWCGPCRKLSPILDEVEQELAGKVKFTKVNTDDNLELAKRYQISGIPTVMIFKDGEIAERMVGLMPKNTIINNIERHI